MSDTNSIIYWALHYTCNYREDPDAVPYELFNNLYYLKQYSNALEAGLIIDGICASTFGFVDTPGGGTIQIPVGGFIADERIKEKRQCGQCPANAYGKAAGCSGYFNFEVRDEKLNSILNDILNGQPDADSCFIKTDPAAYRFWCDSPLTEEQCKILIIIFSELERRLPYYNDSIKHFIRAMEISIESSLPLEVFLLPPGHIDFGEHIIFPHCPRCKSSTNFAIPPKEDDGPEKSSQKTLTSEEIDALLSDAGDRLDDAGLLNINEEGHDAITDSLIGNDKIEAAKTTDVLENNDPELYLCRTCGNLYYPDKTGERKPDEEIDDIIDLAEHLGKEKYYNYLRSYLDAQNYTKEDICFVISQMSGQ